MWLTLSSAIPNNYELLVGSSIIKASCCSKSVLNISAGRDDNKRKAGQATMVTDWREVYMGKVVPFRRREKERPPFDSDFTGLLRDVVAVGRQTLGTEENGIFRLHVSFEELVRAKIGSFIIQNRLMNTDLFRCGLYVSHVLSEMLSKEVESYYITDYLIRGIEEDNSAVIQQGADLCYVLCVFFKERERWRMMKPGDYVNMGIRLYSLYYSRTGKLIGSCMSKHFETIVSIARKCIVQFEQE